MPAVFRGNPYYRQGVDLSAPGFPEPGRGLPRPLQQTWAEAREETGALPGLAWGLVCLSWDTT